MNEYEAKEWIYSKLEDEESRFIFKNRVKFNDTEDYLYINRIVEKYVTEFKNNIYYPGKENELDNIIKKRESKVIIFGAGIRGKRLLERFNRKGIEVDFFCDNDCSLHHSRINGKIPVISMQELEEKKLFNDHIIVVSPMYQYDEIVNMLLHLKCPKSNIFRFSDYAEAALVCKQYFDKDIIRFEENEVFIDGGCFDFWSSRMLLEELENHGMVCKRIYAFEPDEKNYEKCNNEIKKNNLKNVDLVQAGLWSENVFVQFVTLGNTCSRIIPFDDPAADRVEAISLDSYCKEKITFIKMDIEGAELEALKGARNILLTYKPKLAISIYHKKEDLWQIPLYIKKLVPDYKLYIRHYSNNQSETVLYAVCK